MGKRSTSRRLAMQILYQMEVGKRNLEESKEAVFAEGKLIPATKEFATQLAHGSWENVKEIDEKIRKYAIGWETEHMSGVDLSILRLATCELFYMTETPKNVVIDEALELAKKFSAEQAVKFINGILGSMVKEFVVK